MRYRKSGPSVARMVKFLGITKAQATELKRLMEDGYVYTTLDRAEELLGAYGRDYLTPSDGGLGVTYVNLGDTYATTLMFDHMKQRFIVGTWGDQVEAQPRRFA